MKTTKKIRIDRLLVEKALAPSRERAQALVMAGKVWVGSERVHKASQVFQPTDPVHIRGSDHPYVSRGGLKLQEALEHFQVEAKGRICLDVGASTGGFTDCLLQKGAARVYAFDTGTHQLHERLRADPRVVSVENRNARYFVVGDLPQTVSLVVIDVSFISLKKILPPLCQALPWPWEGLILVKPQFEAGPKEVGKGGIVREAAVRERVVREIQDFCRQRGLNPSQPLPCSLKGTAGNREFFIHLRHQPYNS